MVTFGLPTGEDSTSANEGFRSCGSGRCSAMSYEDTEGSVETVSFDSEDDLLPEDFSPGGGGGKTPDGKKCWFAEDYSRKCDTHEEIINTATAQECLSECLSNSIKLLKEFFLMNLMQFVSCIRLVPPTVNLVVVS